MGTATSDKSLNEKRDKGISYADKRRDEKRKALRDYISGQKYIQAINNDLNREDITNEELPVIKFKTETRLKLLSKVLPDLKAIEHSGDEDNPVRTVMQIKLIDLTSE